MNRQCYFVSQYDQYWFRRMNALYLYNTVNYTDKLEYRSVRKIAEEFSSSTGKQSESRVHKYSLQLCDFISLIYKIVFSDTSIFKEPFLLAKRELAKEKRFLLQRIEFFISTLNFK